jgi:hypothetical protein
MLCSPLEEDQHFRGTSVNFHKALKFKVPEDSISSFLMASLMLVSSVSDYTDKSLIRNFKK